MRIEESRLFEKLEPPPGGADRFRRRLNERCGAKRSRGRHYAIAGLAVSVLALFVVLAFTRSAEIAGPLGAGVEAEPRIAGVYDAPEFDRLLGRPMQPAAFSISIDGKSAAVSEIRRTRENVRIYVVSVE